MHIMVWKLDEKEIHQVIGNIIDVNLFHLCIYMRVSYTYSISQYIHKYVYTYDRVAIRAL